MRIELMNVVAAAGAGVGATVLMDLWNLFLKRVFGIPSLDFCRVGKLLRTEPHECIAGWTAHYSIGTGLAVGLMLLTNASSVIDPNIGVDFAYGVLTVVFPFLLLQPALGVGVASSKAPHPTQARLKSIASHTVYGLGLFVTALPIRQILF